MSYVEVETGNIVKRWAFWNPATWSIPKLYWDAWSQEQRLHAICRQLEKVIKYADYLGVNVDDIAQRMKAIEEGQLDPIIQAAIETWFEENEPQIIQAIEQLQNEVAAIESQTLFMFDNVGHMQESETLEAGMYCRTNGFHYQNDGGGAWYVIDDTGTANGMDVIGIPEIDPVLFAYLIDDNNVCSYGADKQGINDSYDALMRYAETHAEMELQPGTYAISEPLDFTDTNCRRLNGHGATIKAAASMDFMVKLRWRKDGYTYSKIENVCIDGNDNATDGIYTTQQMIVDGIEMTGVKEKYITMSKSSGVYNATDGQNVFISNVFVNNNPGASQNATGIYVSSDSHISHCKFWGLKTAIQMSGSYNFVDDCNFWHYNSTFERIGIKRDDSNLFSPMFVNNCYFDGMNIAFSNISVLAANCMFLYGTAESNAYGFYIFDPANNMQWLSKNSEYHAPKFMNCTFNGVGETDDDIYANLLPLTPAIKLVNCLSNINYNLNTVRNLFINPIAPNKFQAFKSQTATWYEFMRLVHPDSSTYSISFDVVQNSNYSSKFKVLANDGKYFKIQKLYGEGSIPAYAANHNLASIDLEVDGVKMTKFLIFLESFSTETSWNFENAQTINSNTGLFLFQKAQPSGLTTADIQANGKQIEVIS